MRQTNQLRNLSFSPLTLSLSHFLSVYQTWTTDNQPPTHPPLLCVCSVAISKSISCHFSFLPSQFCFLHPAQGDKACSVVWWSTRCTFLVEYSPSRDTRRCYALDGVVVDCVNHMISVSLHSAAGGDVFSQAAPSLLFPHLCFSPTCSLSVHGLSMTTRYNRNEEVKSCILL